LFFFLAFLALAGLALFLFGVLLQAVCFPGFVFFSGGIPLLFNPFFFCACGAVYVVADGKCPKCGSSLALDKYLYIKALELLCPLVECTRGKNPIQHTDLCFDYMPVYREFLVIKRELELLLHKEANNV